MVIVTAPTTTTGVDPVLRAAIDAKVAEIQTEQAAEHADAIRAKSAVKRQMDHSESVKFKVAELATLLAQLPQ